MPPKDDALCPSESKHPRSDWEEMFAKADTILNECLDEEPNDFDEDQWAW